MFTRLTPERWPNESAASLTPLPAAVVPGIAAWLPFPVLLWLLAVTAWNSIKSLSSLAESEDVVYLDTATSPLLSADSLAASPGTKNRSFILEEVTTLQPVEQVEKNTGDAGQGFKKGSIGHWPVYCRGQKGCGGGKLAL